MGKALPDAVWFGQADDYLASTDLDWIVLRPSLVYAEGAFGGTALFRALSVLPFFVPVIGRGDQLFQPLHVDDLAAAILRLLDRPAIRRVVIDPVGPDTVTMRQMLVDLRNLVRSQDTYYGTQGVYSRRTSPQGSGRRSACTIALAASSAAGAAGGLLVSMTSTPARGQSLSSAVLGATHIARDRGGSSLAVINCDRLVARREIHQHETAAADIAGLRMRHRERKADRHRGIDGIAAGFENFDTDMRRELLLARHHAVLRNDRQETRRIGEDRRLRGRGGLGQRKRDGGRQSGRRNRHEFQ